MKCLGRILSSYHPLILQLLPSTPIIWSCYACVSLLSPLLFSVTTTVFTLTWFKVYHKRVNTHWCCRLKRYVWECAQCVTLCNMLLGHESFQWCWLYQSTRFPTINNHIFSYNRAKFWQVNVEKKRIDGCYISHAHVLVTCLIDINWNLIDYSPKRSSMKHLISNLPLNMIVCEINL